MEISNSAWRELQLSLTEDFVDLLLPPTYAFCVDTRYPGTAGMEALIKDRLTSIDFPEQKILNLESLVKEQHVEDFPDRVGDWGVLFSYHVLEGFGHKLASNLEGDELEGLKQLASLWGTYLAKEMERFFNRRQIFTAGTDLMFDLFLGLFRQIPVKELGEAIRESVTPAYIRAGEMVHYEIAVFRNNQARMSDCMSVIKASDTELQHEIADMFREYSTKRLGEEMQRSITEAMSQFREVFSSSDFKDRFDNQIPAAISAGFRNMSWYLGYRISQNLGSDKQRTTRLLEAVTRHKEIESAMEQYRYRHDWQGDRNRVVELAWQAIAPKCFRLSSKLEDITEDEEQEKLIGMVQGLEDYTKKNRAIKALTDGFSGALSAYLKTTAQNEEKDYWDKNKTAGNRVLTEAKHASDLRSVDEEEDDLSDEEILSREKEKRRPSGNPSEEQLEARESYRAWYRILTQQERKVVKFKLADYTQERIAVQMGISQQRVFELLQQAFKKWSRIST